MHSSITGPLMWGRECFAASPSGPLSDTTPLFLRRCPLSLWALPHSHPISLLLYRLPLGCPSSLWERALGIAARLVQSPSSESTRTK